MTLKNTGFSALDYSNAVADGKLTDDFVEYPILKNCKAYLQIIDKYVEHTVKSIGQSNELNDKFVCLILQLLNWRERFINITSMPIFERTKSKRAPVLKEEIIPFLNVHSKWVQKYLLGELFNLQGKKNIFNKFTSELEKIGLNTAKNYSKISKVSKKLRKYYGQPKLYKNQEEYESCIARGKLYNEMTLDVNEPLDRQINKIQRIGISDITLAYDVPNREIIDAIEDNLAKLATDTNAIKSLSEFKLMPINLYVIQRIIKILQPYFLEIMNKFSDEDYDFDTELRSNTQEILSTLICLGKVMKGFPAAFLNQLQVIQKLLENNQELDYRISALPVTFWIELFKMLVSSPVTNPLPFLKINDLVNSEDQVEAIPTNTARLSTNLPLLPFYLQNLTTCIDVSTSHPIMAYERVALKDRVEYSMQLQSILNVLWKNIGTLDSTGLLKLKSDAIFESKKYEQLIDCLSYVISENYTVHEIMSQICDNIIEDIQLYFKGDAQIIDMFVKANDIYKQILTITTSDVDENVKTKIKILTSELSLLTSLLFVRIMAEISPIDHVEKYRLKVQYIEEDIDMFDKLLSTYYVHGIISGAISENRNIEKASEVTLDCYKQGTDNREKLKKIHPYCSVIMDLKKDTALKVHKYASGNTFRPNEPSYNNFVKDCKHFTKSVLSDKSMKTMYTNLLSTCDELYEIIRTGTHNKATRTAQTVVKETSTWLYSVKAFNKKIDNYSEAFPDLAKPLQSSLTQIMYSVISLNDLIRELLVKIEQGPLFRGMLTSLMEYPNTIPSLDAREKHLNRYVSANFMHLLNRNVVIANDDTSQAERECLEILKMNLSELSMNSLALERIDDVTLNAVLTTLNAVTTAWEKQRQDLEKQKQDEEALYVTKSKCEDEDEEAEAYEEIMEMFPSYSDSDFAEFKPPTLEQKKIKPPSIKPKLLITPEDVSMIYKWHSNFVRNLTTAQWLTSPKKFIGSDVVSPLLLRYPTFSKVIQGAWEALDVDFEGTISPSLLVLVSHIKEKVDGTNGSNQKVDFYRSSWISETRECVPLLERVKDNTNQLLDQWPDFPTLKDIIIIVDRITGFPITSPVSRFLTGLELLRDKVEEWNKNAHKGNNMIDVSLAIGQQIINWRKLEMSHWKECLNNLYQRKQSEAHKYWFYMYAVITSYLEDSDVSSARVVSVLKEFMEKSNLAEFEVRLDIVYVYHCHLLHLEANERRDELLSILWNTFNYYDQFSSQVATLIKEKRAPIEKKLKDYVKICTWDRDLSYWSVKDTVEKAHKALHKHTKEFEKILKESVCGSLVVPAGECVSHVGIWDRPKRAAGAAAGGAYMIDSTNHAVLTRNVKKYLDQCEQPCPLISENSLLLKIPSLLNKAKALCKDTITNTGYPGLVQGLDDFVTLVIESSEHLSSLEVESTASKEKQKSQAKNITQQKRKALADLFKYLTKMGLNYRTGLVILSASENLYDFTIPPVDLDAAISYLKSRRCDATLALLWSGCEKYFQKNIARHRLLSIALQSPHADLGIQNIDRCKGFAAQLLKYTNTQKKSISRYTRHIYDLRTVATNLTNALEIDANSNITKLKEKLDILVQCYAHTSILLDQFNVVLKSIPEKHMNTDSEPYFDKVLSSTPLADCFKDSDEWQCLYKKTKSIVSLVDKQKTVLNKLSRNPKQIGNAIDLPVISQNHIDIISEAKMNLDVIIEKSNEIVKEYQFIFKTSIVEDFVPHHPILRCIENLVIYIKETKIKLEELDEPSDQDMEESYETMIVQTEDIVATMLLVIQSLYKKHLPPEKSSENIDVLSAIDELIDEGEKEESKEILEDNHLKELLQEKITNDSRMLQLETLVTKMRQLLVSYVQFIATRSEVEEVRTAVMRLIPILEQLVLFVQYFVSQKVAVHRVSCKMLSVLLKIFSDLAMKGFCKPSDLDSEEGEGEGSTGASGMGLGEGEGQKDVSERIENQDQLDDARKPGEDKNEEDRDCKEEEKGVNMTDDFDSHLQDMEKKEGDSDEEKDEDDADKQMGDTDNAAEKLDQQIWGSEDEEDLDEEQNKKDKEERGKGESTGEKEMGAKEEEQGTDDGTEGKEKKKKDINEMEPEVDDDHVDPYHGKHQEFPEPEDFEMPETLDLDGEEKDDKDGETETENPFEIDAMKEAIQEEEQQEEEKDDKGNRDGLDVSSDEEGDGNDDEQNKNDQNETDQENKNKDEKESDENEETETETPEETTEETQPDPNNPETEPEQESDPDKELPKNPDDITEEEEKHESNPEANPNADPSNRDPSAEDKVENAEMEKGTNDNVQMNTEPVKDEEAAPYEQAQEQVGENIQSTGRSELDNSDKGHRGDKQAARAESREQRTRFENRPGKTDQERTLGDINQKKHKQVHTLEAEQDAGEDTEQTDEQADAYQHVKQAKQDDIQVIDAATKEQADEQPTIQQEDDADKLQDEEVPMDVDDDDITVDKSEELKPEKSKDNKGKDEDKSGKKNDGEDATGETGLEIEGSTVATETVPRGRDTTYHTRIQETSQQAEDITAQEYMSIREWLESGSVQGSVSSSCAWRSVWRECGAAARALCERLRLVLEPTGRSRRAGDFRTGRAINMRRVIPYIASHFRKDRIWLRRTKPAKREYKIAIAIDDSSSMSDNRSKELAFESLALVSQALNLLESGDLAVLSFGEKPNLLHPFTEQFSEHSGSKILEQLRFEQTKTKIAQLLDFCTVMFDQQSIRSDALNAKLLVIVSDGRGIFSEGETKVLQAVRRARQQAIFLVYVIIDNPDNKDSIMDIRRPIIDPVTNSLSGFVSYLDTFPFPFYLILRDMSALPTVLGDALRQWFELAANTAN